MKKYLMIGGLIIGFAFFYSKQKINQLSRVFEQLKIMPKNIKNLVLSFDKISFVTDILLTNPTNESFEIPVDIATLTRLNFFYNGQYIGTAKPQISEINIPANNQLEIKNIPVVIPVQSILQNINVLTTFQTTNLSVEAVIEVAGKEFFIK